MASRAETEKKINKASILEEKLGERREAFEAILKSSEMDVDRFYRMALNIFAGNPAIRECEDWSLLRCVMNAAELGLEIGGSYKPHCYIVPHRIGRTEGRDKTTAQLYISYFGVMELARRAGISGFHADIWQEKDNFRCLQGTNPAIEHERLMPEKNAGEWLGAYCVWTTVRGDKQFVQLFRDEIEQRRDKSASFKSRNQNDSPWVKHPRSMWKKSAVHEGGKYMEMDRRLQRALELESLAEAGGVQRPEQAAFLEVFPADEELEERTRTDEAKALLVDDSKEARERAFERFKSLANGLDEDGRILFVNDFMEKRKLKWNTLKKKTAAELSALADDLDFESVLNAEESF